MRRLANTLKALTGRTLAFIVLKVSTVGGGTMLWSSDRALSLTMAVYVAVLEVAEEVSRAYLNDGKIDKQELNDRFSDLADKQKRK